MDLLFDQPLPPRSGALVTEAGLPYRLAVPFIVAASAGLWVGVWQLASLLLRLIR
jgi:hypothetical protein